MSLTPLQVAQLARRGNVSNVSRPGVTPEGNRVVIRAIAEKQLAGNISASDIAELRQVCGSMVTNGDRSKTSVGNRSMLQAAIDALAGQITSAQVVEMMGFSERFGQDAVTPEGNRSLIQSVVQNITPTNEEITFASSWRLIPDSVTITGPWDNREEAETALLTGADGPRMRASTGTPIVTEIKLPGTVERDVILSFMPQNGNNWGGTIEYSVDGVSWGAAQSLSYLLDWPSAQTRPRRTFAINIPAATAQATPYVRLTLEEPSAPQWLGYVHLYEIPPASAGRAPYILVGPASIQTYCVDLANWLTVGDTVGLDPLVCAVSTPGDTVEDWTDKLVSTHLPNNPNASVVLGAGCGNDWFENGNALSPAYESYLIGQYERMASVVEGIGALPMAGKTTFRDPSDGNPARIYNGAVAGIDAWNDAMQPTWLNVMWGPQIDLHGYVLQNQDTILNVPGGGDGVHPYDSTQEDIQDTWTAGEILAFMADGTVNGDVTITHPVPVARISVEAAVASGEEADRVTAQADIDACSAYPDSQAVLQSTLDGAFGSTVVLIDCGATDAFDPNINNTFDKTVGTKIANLVDTNGVGVGLSYANQSEWGGTNSTGAGGSTGEYVDAVETDHYFGSEGNTSTVRISGFTPGRSVTAEAFPSRIGSGTRTTRMTIGASSDTANAIDAGVANTTDVMSVTGTADGSGNLDIDFDATAGSQFYYCNWIRISYSGTP